MNVPPPGSHMGVHGMVAFGSHYLSHIPMFHQPHDYQIVMDVDFHVPDNFGDELHTFVPDKFSLGDLLNGKIKQLHGTMFKGNFEDGGTEILSDVTADVKQILQEKHLDPDSKGPEQLEYVLYSSGNDAYLVHPINGNADFDQIVHLAAAPAGLDGASLSVPGHANSVAERLTPQSGAVTARLENGQQVPLQVDRELSCLVGPHFDHGPG